MSSNLGQYQLMTTIAKKVGGPLNLAGLIFLAGGIVTHGVAQGGKKVKNHFSAKFEEKKQLSDAAIIYTINTEGISNEGLLFNVGDQFRVLEKDGDAALIEKLEDDNNPYFVSASFLSSISDYTFD
jgi:hypothetical protein